MLLIKSIATGLVSCLSIPCIKYPIFFNYIRNLLCSFYLIGDCFIRKQNTEAQILYTLHHLCSLYLIFTQTTDCNNIVNDIFFLEFSSFLFHFTTLIQYGKNLSKLYWLYDRFIRLPILIVNNSYCTQKYNMPLMLLMYIGFVWSFEVIKLIKYKHVFSLIILMFCHNLHLQYIK